MQKSLDFISKGVSIILIALVVIIIIDIFNRYLFSDGSIMMQELEWHFFDVFMLFSLFYTLKVDGHVRVDIFYSKLSEKHKRYVDIFSQIFFILPFSILIIYFSYNFIELSFIQGENSPNPNGLPYRFIVKSLIIFGFTLLAVQSTLHILNFWRNR